ncbi:MAG TPA: OB-fold nucleic acid binding domain-containing protein [Alphaproteobacteria bacterium]
MPVENAAMADRTVIEWNKEDLDALGILKIDVLALGMLTCIAKCFDLIAEHHGRRFDLATVPPDDPAVYDMLCKADSVGVFQVESRAQMTMLPRLKPRCFYDLVIEVAIVRPGPIQGDMVHPYLRRRDKKEAVDYPSEELREVLGRTLGVPLFQEQAMKIAIVAAGFTPSEADQLRRAMAAFRRAGTIQLFGEKLVAGMIERGYSADFADRCFKQIEGFGEYGFPESHAASFALLVYVSAWLKCHYPAAFAAAILNSQPMGFYAPAQLVRDACEHAVEARPPDINHSLWDCTLEPATTEGLALRLGLRLVKGAHVAELSKLLENRGNGYMTLTALWRRSGVLPTTLERLADADAYQSLGLSRRQALWNVKALAPKPLPLFAAVGEEEIPEEHEVALPVMAALEEVAEDYRALSLSLKAHPVSFLRDVFTDEGVVTNARLAELPSERYVTVSGLVLIRQRPGTASGVIFMTIEDETGVANLVVWTDVFERFQQAVLTGQLVVVRGRLQHEGAVIARRRAGPSTTTRHGYEI